MLSENSEFATDVIRMLRSVRSVRKNLVEVHPPPELCYAPGVLR